MSAKSSGRRSQLSGAVPNAPVGPGLPPNLGRHAALPVAFLRKITSDEALIGVFVASLFLDDLRLPGSGGLFNVRPSFIVFAFVLPVMAIRWLVRRQTVWETPLIGLLVALDAIFFLSTLINPSAPYHVRGLVSCLLLLVNVAVYMATFGFAARKTGRLELLYSMLIGAAAAYAIVGVTSLVLFELGFSPASHLVALRNIGDLTMNGGLTPTPRPLMFEPNIGSYMAAIGLLAVARSVSLSGRVRWLYALGAVWIFIGVLLSYSRGAWLGTICGLVAMAVVLPFLGTSLTVDIRKIVVGACLILVVGAGAVVTAPSVKAVVSSRLENLINVQRGTGHERLAFWEAITRDSLKRPILGHGSDSYRALLPPPPANCGYCGAYVAENVVVQIFNTSGIIGLVVYLGLQVMVVRMAVTAVKRSGRGPRSDRGLVLAAIGAYVTIVLCSLTNPSFWGNLYWVLWAVSVASLQWAIHNSQRPSYFR